MPFSNATNNELLQVLGVYADVVVETLKVELIVTLLICTLAVVVGRLALIIVVMEDTLVSISRFSKVVSSSIVLLVTAAKGRVTFTAVFVAVVGELVLMLMCGVEEPTVGLLLDVAAKLLVTVIVVAVVVSEESVLRPVVTVIGLLIILV